MNSSRRRFLSDSLLPSGSAGSGLRDAHGRARRSADIPAEPRDPARPEALDALFATPPADRVVWGVSVRSLADESLYQRNTSLLLHPASNMKLVTLAACAERLGWDFRFETDDPFDDPVAARRHASRRSGRDWRRRPDNRHAGTTVARRWRTWPTSCGQRGVRRIEGRIIGDGSAFGGTSFGEGWQWDDLPFSYAAPVSALIYNENTAEFVVATRTVGRRAWHR